MEKTPSKLAPAILLPTVAVAAISALGAAVALFLVLTQSSRRAEEGAALARTDNYRLMIETMVRDADYSGIEDFATLVLADHNVKHLVVESEYGVIYEGTSGAPDARSRTEVFDILADVDGGTEARLGTVSFGLVTHGSVRNAPAAWIALIVGLAFLAFASGVFVILNRRIRHPIERIHGVVTRYEGGAWTLSRVDGPKEIADLNAGFGALAEKLASHAQALEQANLVLGEQVEAEQRMRETLAHAQKMEAVGLLASGIVHDFNNSLAVVMGSLEVIEGRAKRNQEVSPRVIASAFSAVDQAVRLTRRLLTFARGGSEEHETFDLGDLLEESSDLLRRLVGEDLRLSLAIDRQGPPLLVHANRDEVINSVINLCLNARDAASQDGLIEVTLRSTSLRESDCQRFEAVVEEGIFAELCVSDNGTGISSEELTQVMDPFFTTKSERGGTGLGIAMVKKVANDSGGTLEIASELGVGTVVSMFFPLGRRMPALEDPAEEEADSSTVLAPRLALVVDDNEDLGEVLKTLLELEGCSVLTASSFAVAVELLRTGSEIDLVLSDVVVPGEPDVLGFLDAVNSLRPSAHVVLITGFADLTVLQAIRERGNYPVFSKPISRRTLQEILRLGRSSK